jgi:hypothetical protein
MTHVAFTLTCLVRAKHVGLSLIVQKIMTFWFEQPHHLTDLTISTKPNIAQTTVSNLTMATSHHDRWKTITLTLNISQAQHHKRWKTCLITHDYRAKEIYPTINPNPKGILCIGSQINACRQICELEKERA